MAQTLLLSTRFTDDSNLLWRAALDAGWESLRVSPAEAARYPAGAPVDAVYGELLFVEALAGARPDLRLLGPSPTWLLSLPGPFLGRVVGCEPLSAARQRTERVFIKPTISKQFPARVYDPRNELVADLVDDDPPVLVSTPVVFRKEARTFVDPSVGPLTGSLYEREGELIPAPLGEDEPAVFGVVSALCRAGLVPAPMVVDVGQLEDGRWVVIEANEAWGAGLYACDPNQAFRVVAGACVRVASEPA